MPLELILLIAGVLLFGCFGLVLCAGGGLLLYRRRAERRYGEPPRWMVENWKAKAAAKARRREADERLIDLVEEHHDPGE